LLVCLAAMITAAASVGKAAECSYTYEPICCELYPEYIDDWGYEEECCESDYRQFCPPTTDLTHRV